MLTKNSAKEPCDGLTSPIEEGWGVGGRVVRIAWLFYAIGTRRTCGLRVFFMAQYLSNKL